MVQQVVQTGPRVRKCKRLLRNEVYGFTEALVGALQEVGIVID